MVPPRTRTSYLSGGADGTAGVGAGGAESRSPEQLEASSMPAVTTVHRIATSYDRRRVPRLANWIGAALLVAASGCKGKKHRERQEVAHDARAAGDGGALTSAGRPAE